MILFHDCDSVTHIGSYCRLIRNGARVDRMSVNLVEEMLETMSSTRFSTFLIVL